jgi:16S rRNA (adenine1518-N6/adenine1519-N6)-dimethyltransferase
LLISAAIGNPAAGRTPSMILTPSATRDLLARLGHQPKRFLGQNFLVDGNIVRKSLELAEITAGDRVVEVGPGLGTLTSALLEAGAEVWAVEKDRQLHAHLAESLIPLFPSTFHLVEGDAVELPLAGLAVQNASPFKVVANLPYAISTPWIDAVLNGPLPSRLVLMLQQEAALRYTAQPGSKQFSAISIFLQSAYSIAPGHKVASNCFFPKPDIESYLLNLSLKPDPVIFPADLKQAIRGCFQQRRKQIGPQVRERLPAYADRWLANLTAAGYSSQSRAEQIPVAIWTQLFRPLV